MVNIRHQGQAFSGDPFLRPVDLVARGALAIQRITSRTGNRHESHQPEPEWEGTCPVRDVRRDGTRPARKGMHTVKAC
jgi:hypothetical protein